MYAGQSQLPHSQALHRNQTASMHRGDGLSHHVDLIWGRRNAIDPPRLGCPRCSLNRGFAMESYHNTFRRINRASTEDGIEDHCIGNQHRSRPVVAYVGATVIAAAPSLDAATTLLQQHQPLWPQQWVQHNSQMVQGHQNMGFGGVHKHRRFRSGLGKIIAWPEEEVNILCGPSRELGPRRRMLCMFQQTH